MNLQAQLTSLLDAFVFCISHWQVPAAAEEGETKRPHSDSTGNAFVAC